MEYLKTRISEHPDLIKLASLLAERAAIHVRNSNGSFRSFIAAHLFDKNQRPVLYVANDLDSAECMRDDMEQLIGRDQVVFLPAVGYEPYDHHTPNPTSLSMRMEAMQKFISEEKWVAVATIEGLIEHFPTPEDFLDNQLYLKKGNTLDFDRFIDHLQLIGFKREELVEQVGDISIRGGIVDVFTWNSEEPIRIELFGDVIESIRKFDVISQRSVKELEEFDILPNLFLSENRTFINRLLPEETVLFLEDKQVIDTQYQTYFDKARRVYLEGDESAPPETLYLNPEKWREITERMSRLSSDLVPPESATIVDFQTRPHPDFNGSIKLFLDDLRKKNNQREKATLFFQCLNRDQAERLEEIIEEEGIAFNGRFDTGTLHSGFAVPALGLEILTDHQIFKRFKRRHTYRRFKSGAYLRQLSNLNLYDYVVHIDYGIGQYMGLSTIDYGGVKKECIKIVYRDNDSLFVTVDRLNRVQKFSSEEGIKPKITKLGSGEWDRVKQRTKESLKQIAAELIQIYAGRKAQNGISFSTDNHWQKELEASFIYEETGDQLKAISDVKKDMEKSEPMDRLLCGDVGFGKTEVALRAAFKAVMDGKQAAVLVPTTILAFQHHQTFSQRMKEFPVRVEVLNRFRSAAEQKRILHDLKEGQVDIIIATHRLLSGDILFKDLGLLVVDEEQRFGVSHKEKLKKYRLSVDVLSMTATPIPRTLHMALMGARDFSNIETPPRNRLPVYTEIMHWTDDKIRYIVQKELKRGGQIYFVHNRVDTIDAVKETLSEIIPEARFVVGHGQLPEHKLEKVMLDFVAGKYDVLVSSMIIENGLDIPNVNTIIINRADKFGLSQLYQLRGRVGRSNVQAFAYLIVPPMDKLTELARKRLRTIQDFTELGSGYKVALRDLEIRGAGNLLGKQQSGFVQTVGFDLYCRILDEAVKELQKGLKIGDGEQPAGGDGRYTDPKLDTDFDLLIPDSFITSELERVAVYHRLVNFTDLEQIENLNEELRDRFGKLPVEVERFLLAIQLKVLAGKMLADRLILKKGELKLFFSEQAQDDEYFFKTQIPKMMNQGMAKISFIKQEKLGVHIFLKGREQLEQMAFAKKVLQFVAGDE